jgi:hypothetical protein
MHAKIVARLLAVVIGLFVALLLVHAPAGAAPPPPVQAVQAPEVAPLSQVDAVAMPALDNAVLLAEEIQRAGPGVAPRFAQPIPVSLTPANSGTWETLPDGSRLWRLRIQSPDAVSLNLGFAVYFMPPGGRLLLYKPDLAVVRGPFTAADNELHGQLWTPIIAGDEVVMEVVLPAAAQSQLRLELGSVNHGFREFGKALLSGSCNVDVVCAAADGLPQVDAWRDQIRAVAAISTGGGVFCSGYLVNNTANDRRPYFITAYHCGITEWEAPSLVVYWNYQNSSCRQPGSPASGGSGDGALSQFSTGSTLRASYAASDVTLVELDDPIDAAFDVYWAGWDARPIDPISAAGIHHPNGEEKRISFESDPLATASYLGNTSPGDGTHLRVDDWDLGTTEPGSSGSPLFSQEGRVVGQLHGGYAACGNDEPDWYGRFAISWSGGGAPQTRLREWLDPLGTGVLVWDGRPDVADFDLQITPTSQGVCAAQDAGYAVDVLSSPGFADPVSLSTQGVPAGALASFSLNPVTPPGSSQLTITNTATAAPGRYAIQVLGMAPTATHTVTIGLDLFTTRPAAPVLLTPVHRAAGVSTRPVFTWAPDAEASSYDIQVATDAAFANIVQSATGVVGTRWQPASDLAESTAYYWRVRAGNACGAGVYADAFRFTTRAGPGQCSPGFEPHIFYREDFESGAPGWSHGGDGDTWVLSGRAHGGAYAYQAAAPSYVTDQKLVSPPLSLPSEEAPLTLAFWNFQFIEHSTTGGCFDGALLEVSADDGATWTQITTGLLTDPYDGSISSTYGNPLSGLAAWCGDPQDWLNSAVELDAYAGQTIRLRFRLGTDDSVGREGWAIDDLVVQSCQPTAPTAQIDVAPAALQSYQLPGSATNQTLTVRNDGTAPLVWQIAEEPPPLAGGELPAAGGQRRLPALPSAEELALLRTGLLRTSSMAPREDVLNDGSFEGGSPNPFWDEASSTFGTPLCGPQNCSQGVGSGSRTGAWWLWFGGVARLTETAQVSQTVMMRAAPAELSFWLEMPTAQTPATMTVALDDTAVFVVTVADAISYPLYSEVRVDVSAFADGYSHVLRFDAITSGGPGVTNIFVDDVALHDAYMPPCSRLDDVPWLLVTPISGAVAPGAESAPVVTFDATGLAPGAYSANLCVVSNDPDDPLVVIPATMRVVEVTYRHYLPMVVR